MGLEVEIEACRWGGKTEEEKGKKKAKEEKEKIPLC